MGHKLFTYHLDWTDRGFDQFSWKKNTTQKWDGQDECGIILKTSGKSMKIAFLENLPL